MSKDLGQQMIDSYRNTPNHNPETLAELERIYKESQQATTDEGTTPGEQASVPNSKPAIRTEIEAIVISMRKHNQIGNEGWNEAVDAIMSKLETIIPECYIVTPYHNLADLPAEQRKLGYNDAVTEMRLRAGL